MGRAQWIALAAGLALSLRTGESRAAEGPGAPLDPAGFARLGAFVLFSATTPSNGRELWRTDGTAAGTALVRDLAPGPADGFPGPPVVLGDRAYLSGGDGNAPEVWVTDGTAGGTRPSGLFPLGPLLDLGLLGAVPGRLTAVTRDAELWQSDGRAPATRTYSWADRCGGSACGVAVLRPHGGDLYAVSYARAQPNELWRIRAPGQGERLLAGFGRFVGELPAGLLFSGGAGPLWLADASGARVLAPVDAQFGASGDSAELRGALLFAGRDAAGVELWRTDGTAAGTARLAPLPAAPDGGPFAFVRAGERVFFLASDGARQALWATDGTLAGTRALRAGAEPGASPVALGAAVIFAATVDGVPGVWRSDGTPDGTIPLARLAAAPRGFWTAGELVWFGADAGDGQLRPWRTDGTPAGTMALAEASAPVVVERASAGGGGCGAPGAASWPVALWMALRIAARRARPRGSGTPLTAAAPTARTR